MKSIKAHIMTVEDTLTNDFTTSGFVKTTLIQTWADAIVLQVIDFNCETSVWRFVRNLTIIIFCVIAEF